MKEIAIIGPTASGKSALAVEMAKRHHAYILSLDSLSIYKYIDIISAKPTIEERQAILHFGIDLIEPDCEFSARDFMDLYESTKKECQRDGKNLIIVGGSSFYLKTLIDGLSHEPELSERTKSKVKTCMSDINEAYRFLEENDPELAAKILPNDRYRIEKAIAVFIETGIPLSRYRTMHAKEYSDNEIQIFEIEVERELLRQKIFKRAEMMIRDGAIDETAWLEQRYTRSPKSMRSIGIKEILSFLDGRITKAELPALIATHTAQFAKRQSTFNRNQFDHVILAPLEKLGEQIESYFNAL